MVRINLLPHRAEKRRIRQLQFFGLIGASFLLGAIVVFIGDWLINDHIEYQNRRNDYLKTETAKLVKEIEEIEKLRTEIKGLQKRKEVVDGLQDRRLDVVHLLDRMLRILPEGVYLKSLKQEANNRISITGMTQTNARVSTLMENINNSPWLADAKLGQVHTVGTDTAPTRESEFSLSFNLTQNKNPEKKKVQP